MLRFKHEKVLQANSYLVGDDRENKIYSNDDFTKFLETVNFFNACYQATDSMNRFLHAL